MNKNSLIPVVGLLVVLAGCTLAPKYNRPTSPAQTEWPTGPAYSAAQASQGAGASTNAVEASDLNWREFFLDEKLRDLISLALTNNRDLRVATLNVERARSLYGVQRASLFPTINITGSGTRRQVPYDLSGTGQREVLSQYDAKVGLASWEIDLFGRIRSLKDRALEEWLGTEQARRSTQILLVSSVAGTYLALAADRENLKLSKTTLQAQQGSYDLVKRRYDLGLTPELDVYRVQTQVETARRNVTIYTRLVAEDENALCLLLGTALPNELLPADLGSVTPPRPISAGMPSEVLLRRPDVLQAESGLKAAYADLGAARAAFFPRITLTGSAGTSSSELSGLFKTGSGAWSYAPEIVMPIFDARTWSAHRAAKVQREIAVAQYEKAIQSAFRDVSDALAANGTADQEVAAQEALVKAVSETYRLSSSRYDKGLDNYLSVLDAQRSLFSAQQVLVLLRMAKLSNQVQLYAVLGGGWETNSAPGLAMSHGDSAKK